MSDNEQREISREESPEGLGLNDGDDAPPPLEDDSDDDSDEEDLMDARDPRGSANENEAAAGGGSHEDDGVRARLNALGLGAAEAIQSPASQDRVEFIGDDQESVEAEQREYDESIEAEERETDARQREREAHIEHEVELRFQRQRQAEAKAADAGEQRQRREESQAAMVEREEQEDELRIQQLLDDKWRRREDPPSSPAHQRNVPGRNVAEQLRENHKQQRWEEHLSSDSKVKDWQRRQPSKGGVEMKAVLAKIYEVQEWGKERPQEFLGQVESGEFLSDIFTHYEVLRILNDSKEVCALTGKVWGPRDKARLVQVDKKYIWERMVARWKSEKNGVLTEADCFALMGGTRWEVESWGRASKPGAPVFAFQQRMYERGEEKGINEGLDQLDPKGNHAKILYYSLVQKLWAADMSTCVIVLLRVIKEQGGRLKDFTLEPLWEQTESVWEGHTVAEENVRIRMLTLGKAQVTPGDFDWYRVAKESYDAGNSYLEKRRKMAGDVSKQQALRPAAAPRGVRGGRGGAGARPAQRRVAFDAQRPTAFGVRPGHSPVGGGGTGFYQKRQAEVPPRKATSTNPGIRKPMKCSKCGRDGHNFESCHMNPNSVMGKQKALRAKQRALPQGQKSGGARVYAMQLASMRPEGALITVNDRPLEKIARARARVQWMPEEGKNAFIDVCVDSGSYVTIGRYEDLPDAAEVLSLERPVVLQTKAGELHCSRKARVDLHLLVDGTNAYAVREVEVLLYDNGKEQAKELLLGDDILALLGLDLTTQMAGALEKRVAEGTGRVQRMGVPEGAASLSVNAVPYNPSLDQLQMAVNSIRLAEADTATQAGLEEEWSLEEELRGDSSEEEVVLIEEEPMPGLLDGSADALALARMYGALRGMEKVGEEIQRLKALSSRRLHEATPTTGDDDGQRAAEVTRHVEEDFKALLDEQHAVRERHEASVEEQLVLSPHLRSRMPTADLQKEPQEHARQMWAMLAELHAEETEQWGAMKACVSGDGVAASTKEDTKATLHLAAVYRQESLPRAMAAPPRRPDAMPRQGQTQMSLNAVGLNQWLYDTTRRPMGQGGSVKDTAAERHAVLRDGVARWGGQGAEAQLEWVQGVEPPVATILREVRPARDAYGRSDDRQVFRFLAMHPVVGVLILEPLLDKKKEETDAGNPSAAPLAAQRAVQVLTKGGHSMLRGSLQDGSMKYYLLMGVNDATAMVQWWDAINRRFRSVANTPLLTGAHQVQLVRIQEYDLLLKGVRYEKTTQPTALSHVYDTMLRYRDVDGRSGALGGHTAPFGALTATFYASRSASIRALATTVTGVLDSAKNDGFAIMGEESPHPYLVIISLVREETLYPLEYFTVGVDVIATEPGASLGATHLWHHRGSYAGTGDFLQGEVPPHNMWATLTRLVADLTSQDFPDLMDRARFLLVRPTPDWSPTTASSWATFGNERYWHQLAALPLCYNSVPCVVDVAPVSLIVLLAARGQGLGTVDETPRWSLTDHALFYAAIQHGQHNSRVYPHNSSSVQREVVRQQAEKWRDAGHAYRQLVQELEDVTRDTRTPGRQEAPRMGAEDPGGLFRWQDKHTGARGCGPCWSVQEQEGGVALTRPDMFVKNAHECEHGLSPGYDSTIPYTAEPVPLVLPESDLTEAQVIRAHQATAHGDIAQMLEHLIIKQGYLSPNTLRQCKTVLEECMHEACVRPSEHFSGYKLAGLVAPVAGRSEAELVDAGEEPSWAAKTTQPALERQRQEHMAPRMASSTSPAYCLVLQLVVYKRSDGTWQLRAATNAGTGTVCTMRSEGTEGVVDNLLKYLSKGKGMGVFSVIVMPRWLMSVVYALWSGQRFQQEYPIVRLMIANQCTLVGVTETASTQAFATAMDAWCGEELMCFPDGEEQAPSEVKRAAANLYVTGVEGDGRPSAGDVLLLDRVDSIPTAHYFPHCEDHTRVKEFLCGSRVTDPKQMQRVATYPVAYKRAAGGGWSRRDYFGEAQVTVCAAVARAGASMAAPPVRSLPRVVTEERYCSLRRDAHSGAATGQDERGLRWKKQDVVAGKTQTVEQRKEERRCHHQNEANRGYGDRKKKRSSARGTRGEGRRERPVGTCAWCTGRPVGTCTGCTERRGPRRREPGPL
jgi:hypothetical protein